MKYYLVFRSRPDPAEPVPAAHDRVMSGLVHLPPPWGLVRTPWPKAAEPRGEFISPVDLPGCFGQHVRACAHYQNRVDLSDAGSSDDVLVFEFNAKKIDYSILLDTVLPRQIQTTRAYRAQLMPYEYLLEEAARMRPVEQRSAVYNIAPANYFDRELCQRAFGLSPEQLLNTLKGRIAEGRILNDGAYLIATREIVDSVLARQLAGQLKIP